MLTDSRPPIASWAQGLLLLWGVLLLPWLVLGPLSAMGFEGGRTLAAYVFFGAAITYPVSVGIAFVFIRKFPLLTLLPLVNIVVWLSSG
jgi:hypothetical protein